MKNQEVIYYGADYNPEQWEKDVIIKDIELMKTAKVNYVSVNIFSWALLQDNKEQFHFKNLDYIVDLLYTNNIAIDMGTGTSSPPAWLIRKHPDILPVDYNGTTLVPGSRQHYCPSNKTLRKYIANLTSEVAKRYSDHPGIVMWHINNEYTCHIDACYCDNCKNAFQTWLKKKYGSLKELNACWYTKFWSQYYYDWAEINTPSKTPTFINPTQQLDYKRFISQQNYELFMIEKAEIRKYSQLPVMTNFMGLHKHIDGYAWAKDLDIITWNSYPNPFENLPYAQFMANDLMRSLKKQPFLIMESATSAVNWRKINGAQKPEKMMLWSIESVAHGADGIMFFQWRASKGGSEKFHSAMVPHAQDEQSKIMSEVNRLGSDLSLLSEVVGTQFISEVAILFDWENWWALEIPGKPRELRLIHELLDFYRVLRELNIPVSFIHPSDSLEEYRILVSPSHYLLTEESCSKIKQYVANGGAFITTYFSGIVDENDGVHLGGYPGHLKELLGIYVEEFFPIKGENSVVINEDLVPNSTWEEWIHSSDSSTVLATFTSEGLNGKPAIVKNQYGKGTTYYFGTKINDKSMLTIIKEIVDPILIERSPFNENLHWTCRASSDSRYHFLLNYSESKQFIKLERDYIDLLEGANVNGSLEVGVNGFLVLKECLI